MSDTGDFFDKERKQPPNAWWDAWKRAIASLYEAWTKIDELTAKVQIGLVQVDNFRDANTSLRTELRVQGERLGKLHEEFDPLKRAYKRAADELREADEVLIEALDEISELRGNAPAVIYKERQIALNEVSDLRRNLTSANQAIDSLIDESDLLRKENTKLRDRAVDDWLKQVSGILSAAVGAKVNVHPGPNYTATAEQYVIQSRAAADKLAIVEAGMRNLKCNAAERAVENFKTARILGAGLGHWQGFVFSDGEDGRKRGYRKPPKTCPVVPWNTRFGIGGKVRPTDGGAMSYWGTEVTTIKIKDDTLSRALETLLVDDCPLPNQGGQSVGSGQSAEISAAVTIQDGGRILLKLKVGREVYEIQTHLTAGGW